MQGDFLGTVVVPILYLLSAILFIFGLKGLTRIRSARRGNMTAALAMLVAVIGTLLEMEAIHWTWILSASSSARRSAPSPRCGWR